MPSNLEVHDFNQPGQLGLNTQEASLVLPGAWASVAENLDFDKEGVMRPRPCLVPMVEQPGSTVYSLHTFKYTDTSNFLFEQFFTISSSTFIKAGGFGASWATASGGTVTTARYNSVQLGDRAFFFARGEPIQVVNLSTSGSPGSISGVGSAPEPHIVCAAFGRLWGADVGPGNGQKRTLYWSVLQNGEDWSGTGSGSLDLTSVWGASDDEITAIKEFNNTLIVFSLNRITIIGNPQAATFTNTSFETGGTMYVKDMIPGVGCVSRDAAANVGDEVVFLSFNGLLSLSRVIQERSNPMQSLAPQINDILRDVAITTRTTAIQSPTTGRPTRLIYDSVNKKLMLFTNGSTHYVFHMNLRKEGGIIPVTSWSGITVEDAKVYQGNDGNTYVVILGTWPNSSGTKVGWFYYSNILNYPSSGSERETYTATLATTWDAFQKPSIQKHMKRALLTHQGSNTTWTVKLKYNFQDSTEMTFTGASSSGTGFKVLPIAVGGSGETVLMTVSWPVTYTTTGYRLNRLSLQYKAGRLNSGV